MAFLALASQKSLLLLQQNFLQYQQISIMNQTQQASAQMAAIQKDAGDSDYTEDSQYLYYEQLSEQLESEKDSIETQLTAISQELSSMKQLISNNIKASCGLNLIGS